MRFLRWLMRRYREHAEWIESLPPDVQAEIVRRQNQHF
jgi:hypothetical protein